MARLRFALLVTLATALAGCATTTAYQPPDADYPPGAFRAEGSANALPCLAAVNACP